MAMQKFIISLEGLPGTGMLMHSSRLSNPLDPMTRALKAVSGKRGKTEEDVIELARLEHAGSLYYRDDIGPYLPSDNIFRSLQDSARKSKRGKLVEQGVIFTTDANPLDYKSARGTAGPRTLDALWADDFFRHVASVKVTTSRVMRTRPIFHQWSTVAEGYLDTSLLDLSELADIAELAGGLIGIGDWRPRFGRYQAEVVAG